MRPQALPHHRTCRFQHPAVEPWPSLEGSQIGFLEVPLRPAAAASPLAAVYYLLGEEFDRDPFLLFKLRGMNREEFIGLLSHDQDILEHDQDILGHDQDILGHDQNIHGIHDTHDMHGTHSTIPHVKVGVGIAEQEVTSKPRRRKSADATAAGAKGDLSRQPEEPLALAPEPPQPAPLACDTPGFWGAVSLPDNPFGEVRTPPIAAALPKRLGNFPFWRGEKKFLEAIEPIYTRASMRGMELFLGEWKAKRKG